MEQLGLFDGVLKAYAEAGSLSNADLYARLCESGAMDARSLAERVPIGVAGALHSPAKRSVRWYQQSLKQLGLLDRESRGVWKLTPKGEGKLTEAKPSSVLVGFSTDLGLALWAKCESVSSVLEDRIDLVLSSLPYPLANPRAYGNPPEHAYVDWACSILEPLIARLAPQASIVLNLGNEIFHPGMPSRSLYIERLTLALNERFGLSKMDSMVWLNPARPPGPLQWASRTRQQLNGSYETLLWMCPNPKIVGADNRRVLVPHTATHQALMARGGEDRSTSYGDGSHRVRPGSYGRQTDGKIPRNVISMTHNCVVKRDVARLARSVGLPVHGATMPTRLAKFIIEFLTERNQLVVDPCAGWMNVALASEMTGRRWLAVEQMGEYVLGAALGFRGAPGFQCMGAIA